VKRIHAHADECGQHQAEEERKDRPKPGVAFHVGHAFLLGQLSGGSFDDDLHPDVIH
jgi:hypothetical protein